MSNGTHSEIMLNYSSTRFANKVANCPVSNSAQSKSSVLLDIRFLVCGICTAYLRCRFRISDVVCLIFNILLLIFLLVKPADRHALPAICDRHMNWHFDYRKYHQRLYQSREYSH